MRQKSFCRASLPVFVRNEQSKDFLTKQSRISSVKCPLERGVVRGTKGMPDACGLRFASRCPKRSPIASFSGRPAHRAIQRKMEVFYLNKNLRFVIFSSLMAALSILLGKFLAISIGTDIRISFENLPLFFVSIFLGPLWGMGTGIVADLVGCVLRGYAIIPFITLAQALMGLLPGLLIRFVFKNTKPLSIVLSVAATHLVLSMIVKTFILHFTYGMPLLPLLGWRALTYLPIIPLEAYLCVLLSKNHAIKKQFPVLNGSDPGGKQ